jgi:hypothetical protein
VANSGHGWKKSLFIICISSTFVMNIHRLEQAATIEQRLANL